MTPNGLGFFYSINMSGWIKLHRTLKSWEWYQDANAVRLLVHLLVSVNYEPKKWKGVNIKPGQVVTSLDHLSQDLKLSKQQVRTAIAKLEKSGEITRERTRHCLHVTLVKWDELQGEQHEDNTESNTTITREQHDDNTTITPTKEVKNIRSKEIKAQFTNRNNPSSCHNIIYI